MKRFVGWKTLLFLWIYFSTGCLFSQTGPGGVGNSTNNGLWLDAGRVIANNGDSVESWTDFSGNGLDASQSNNSKQPRYFSTSSLNGQPIIRFDGLNDEMTTIDGDILDNSAGLTYFVALRPNNLDNNPRGILGKRINFNTSSNYAYTWFFHTSRFLNVDLNTQNNRFNSSPRTYNNATNYITILRYKGGDPAASRAKLYDGESLVKTSTETSTSLINSNVGVTLGALNANYGTYLGADYAEVIQFNFAVDSLQRIMVNNYLSAKYNIPLSANDIYKQDEVANGNFDFDVAGIGRINASQIQDDAIGSSYVGFSNPSNLNDNEYLFWGHNGLSGKDYADVPAGIEARLNQVYRVTESNGAGTAVDVGTVDIRWNLSNSTPSIANQLRLLIDTDNDGLFNDETPIGGATEIATDIYEFSGVSNIVDGSRFALATTDEENTPLPITLINFSVEKVSKQVQIEWKTSTEINNDYFEVQRSRDLKNWKSVCKVEGAGTTSIKKTYHCTDLDPIIGTSYYRLIQIDFDGKSESFDPKSIFYSLSSEKHPYPNPSSDFLIIENIPSESIFYITDLFGNKFNVFHEFSDSNLLLDVSNLQMGRYILVLPQGSNFGLKTTHQFIVK